MSTELLMEKMWKYRSIRGLLEYRAAANAEDLFVQYNEECVSYAEMDRLSNQAANAMLSRGIGRGDKVSVMMKNCIEWMAVFFGASKIGAVVCPVNTAYKGDGLAYQLSHSGSRLLVADDEYVERVEFVIDSVPDLEQLLVRDTGARYDAPRLDVGDLTEALGSAGADAPPDAQLNPSDPACILYTSGTTGPPKGCVLPHGQYLVAAEQMILNCDYDSDDILYTCLPLFHINAQNYTVLAMMAAGGSVILDDRFTASGFWQRLIDTGATAFNFIGGIPLMLWNKPPSQLDRAHKARVAFGVPVPLEIWPDWEQRFGLKIVYAYGMTENGLPTLFPVADTPAQEHLRGSGGKASDSAEVAIFDEMDRHCSPYEIGEVATRPKLPWTMMLEYHRNPTATKDAMRNGWFHTGDLGYLNEDGYFFYMDRKKDAFRRRGEMISSWQVESVVAKYPGVSECAAVAVPSELGEDEILIAVVPVEGHDLSPKKLQEFCVRNMARFQVPRYIRTVAGLPKTQTERVEKYRLRDEGVTEGTWDGGGRGPAEEKPTTI